MTAPIGDAEVKHMGAAIPVDYGAVIWLESWECFSEEVTVALLQKEEQQLPG